MGRDWVLPANAHIAKISTHTPAWGATTYVYSITLKLKNFNSHARVGRDLRWANYFAIKINFNSHARVGRDPILQKRDNI